MFSFDVVKIIYLYNNISLYLIQLVHFTFVVDLDALSINKFPHSMQANFFLISV
jgi:hypothetical protein